MVLDNMADVSFEPTEQTVSVGFHRSHTFHHPMLIPVIMLPANKPIALSTLRFLVMPLCPVSWPMKLHWFQKHPSTTAQSMWTAKLLDSKTPETTAARAKTKHVTIR